MIGEKFVERMCGICGKRKVVHDEKIESRFFILGFGKKTKIEKGCPQFYRKCGKEKNIFTKRLITYPFYDKIKI